MARTWRRWPRRRWREPCVGGREDDGAFADLARERDGADLVSVAAKTMALTWRRRPRRRWRVRGPGEGEGWRRPGVGGREDDGADLASAAAKTVARSRTWRGRGMSRTRETPQATQRKKFVRFAILAARVYIRVRHPWIASWEI